MTTTALASLAVCVLGGFLLGWAAHMEWTLVTTRRDIRRMVEAQRALLRREARARQERWEMWHVEAETDEEAIAVFHRRAGIGSGGAA